MFGNIKPDKKELKLRDFTDYRAYYCGLCKSMGGKYRALCNMGLSYEAVFIALVLSAVKDKSVKVQMQRCMLHPFVKHPVAVECQSIDTAATVNVLLMYNKLNDNVNDEKHLPSRIAKLWLSGSYKRASENLPEINGIINEKLDDLKLTEESLCDVLDMAAEPFSEMMGETSKTLMPEKGEDMYWFGFFLGKWLYVLDAYEDIEKDKKTGAYNPFVLGNKDMKAEEIRKAAKEDCEYVLFSALDEIRRLYYKLDLKRNNVLIENILFSGMPSRTQAVLSGKNNKKTPKEYMI